MSKRDKELGRNRPKGKPYCPRALLGRRLSSVLVAARLGTLVTVFSVTVAPIARAQVEGHTSLFQYAHLSGLQNTITATRVPVVTDTGTTIYKDVTLQFDVDQDGNLTLSSDFPQVVDSAAALVLSFRSGTYVGPGTVLNGKASVEVNGPGVSEGGATTWSLAASSSADVCTYPSSATWYVGPTSNNPLLARLKRLGITSTAWSYGVAGGIIGGSGPCVNGSRIADNWGPGTLIGVSQSGNALTIASFSRGGSLDDSYPRDQITYRLVTPQVDTSLRVQLDQTPQPRTIHTLGRHQ